MNPFKERAFKMKKTDKTIDLKITESQYADLALSLLAAFRGVESAESAAKAQGLSFERKRALRQIEGLLGEDVAETVRHSWSPEAEEASLAAYQRGLERGKRAARMDRILGSLKESIRRTAEEIQDTIKRMTTPMEYGLRESGQSTRPLIEPILGCRDGNLIVTLTFRNQDTAMPENKESILVYVEGEVVDVFEISHLDQANKELDLAIPLGEDTLKRADGLGCEIRFNHDDLRTIAVLVA